MKYLSQYASAIFKKIIAQMNGDHLKLDNAPDTFIPLTVEHLYTTPIGPVYSFTHWVGPINGDLCRDLDITFVVTKEGIAPLEYQQDLLGTYTEAAFATNTVEVRDVCKYNDLVSFANTWMTNLKDQQKIML